MKCIILAAGYATRLYPLTENFPKPLLDVKGKTILDWLLDDLRQTCIDEFVVVSNHKFSECFRKWASAFSDVTVLDDGTVSNETRLGAVKDIQFALDTLKTDDDILVIAGDNLLDFSLSEFVSYSVSRGTSCIMRYFEPDPNRLKKCGVIELGADDIVVSMKEKPSEPESNWCCPPFYFYTNKDIRMISDAISEGCAVDAPGSFPSWLCSRSPVYAMLMPGNRYDIGNLESYNNVCNSYCREK